MAGAMRAALARSVTYANDRKQFGKAIGRFQAIQHQLSVLACEAHASHMAAEMGCASDGVAPHPLLAAIAKARCSEAAATVAAIAHAVHGAIGITEEYDLQLHTRRLHAWRVAYGSESYWNHEVGRHLVDDTSDLLTFLRERVFAEGPATAAA
jgi:acyl-CoA dehydrogenase